MHLSLKILEPLIVFFIFVLLSLFLGDGLQPITVALGALTLVLMLVIARYKKLPTCSLPPLLHTLWLVLIGYIIIRSLFSDSIGLSITATIRIMCAYLIFYFFAAFGKREWVNVFMTWLVRISLVAIVISFILLLVPRWGYLLPPMNLVFAGFGHNQIVSLLFLTMPLIVKNFLDSPTVKNSTIFLLYIIGFVVSFSRGSLIMLTVLFAYLLISNRKHNKKVQSALLITLATTLFLLLSAQVIVSKVTNPDSLTFIPQFVRRQLVKPFTLEQTRLNYWQQAVSAFKDQPLFGHGPGTFYLLSKRYQEAPNQYSYFAHSFPLETLAESGLIGFILLGGLITLLVIKSRQSNPAKPDLALPDNLVRQSRIWLCQSIQQYNNSRTYNSQLTRLQLLSATADGGQATRNLFYGLILTLGYSFFEFNLNFLAVWLLWWAGWGILNSKQNQIITKPKTPRHINALVLLLLIFYVFSISSLIVKSSKLPDAPKLAFYLAPFDRYHTIKYINSTDDLKIIVSKFAIFLHAKDTQVLNAVLENSKIIKDDFALAERLYKQAVYFDSKNILNFSTFFTLYKNQSVTKWEEIFIFLNKLSLSKTYKPTFRTIESVLRDNFRVKLYEIVTPESRLGNKTIEEYFANVYYKLGLETIEMNPDITEKLWEFSTQLDPSISYYAVELAKLHFTKFSEFEAVFPILSKCQKNSGAAQHCREIESAYKQNNYDMIPPLGYFKNLL